MTGVTAEPIGPAEDILGFHPPLQARSRETLDRLMDALGAMLVDTGPADLAVREMVARARTSVGAFYARFDDRDAALAYASHDFWARSRELWSGYLVPERWEGQSAATIVASVVRTFTRLMLADAERVRAFVRLSLSVPGDRATRRIAEHDRFIAEAMGQLLQARAEEIRHPRPGAAAAEGFRMVLATVRSRVVLEGVEAWGPGDDRRLILTLCRMYGRYLDVWPVPESYGELLGMVCRSAVEPAPHRGRV